MLHGRDWRGDHDLVKLSYDLLDRVLSGQARSDYTGRRLVHLPLAQFILQVLEYGCLLDIVAGFSCCRLLFASLPLIQRTAFKF